MMPRKKRRTILIVSIAVICLLIITGFVVLYLKTDLFKSNETLFTKYLGKNIENMESMSQEFGKSELDTLLEQSKYTSNTQMKVNYTQGLGTSNETTQNVVNELMLKIEGQNDPSNHYQYQTVKLYQKEEQALELETIQKQDTYGIRFSDLFGQFLLVENNNLKELFKKLGYSEEQLQNIPDKVEVNQNLATKISFTAEEKENLKTKYISLMKQDIGRDKFAKQKNQSIQIDGKTVQTDVYALNLTKEQLNNLYIHLLEAIKEDEVVLGKIDQIETSLQLTSLVNQKQTTSLRVSVITKIDEMITKINQSNIGQDETKIIVYENSSQTVRTTIQGTGYEITLDWLSTNNEKYVEYHQKDAAQEQKISLRKSNEKTTLQFTNIQDKETSTVNLTQETSMNGKEASKNTTFSYLDNQNKVEAIIEEKIKLVDQLEKETTFNDENSVKLNKLNQDQLQAIIARVSEGVTGKIKTLEEKISIDEITQVFKAMGIVTEEQKIEAGGVTETERNRFNSQFEMLKGENLKKEEIQKLLENTQNSIVGMEVVSNTELKLKLDQNNKNEEVVKTISSFIEQNKDKTYNVSVEYDETTGLANYIVLTIVTKK